MRSVWGMACGVGLLVSGCFFPIGQPAPQGGYNQPQGGYQQTSGGYQQTGGGYQQTSAGYQQTSAGYQQTSGGYQQASSGPPDNYYSMTLHNSCSETVHLFIGDGEPPFGSGTYTTIGSNTTQSESGTLPETFWITDDSQHPISAFTPSPGSQSVQILSSCSGFAPY